MKSAHIPTRQCIVCMQMKPKSELIRLVKMPRGIIIDKKQKLDGRGVWVDRNIECIKNLKKRKALERKFKCAINDELYEEIYKFVDESK